MRVLIARGVSAGQLDRTNEHDHDVLRDRGAPSTIAALRHPAADPAQGGRRAHEVESRADHRGHRWRGRALPLRDHSQVRLEAGTHYR